MIKLNKIMKDTDITKETKIRIVNAMVFPVMMYGCEGWTLLKSDRKKIDSFELWCWRKLLHIDWTMKRTNRSIIEEIKPDCTLEARIVQQQLTYFGHIMRADTSLEKMIMLGEMAGRRRRGRPRLRWMDRIKEATGKSLNELKEVTRDRAAWRTLTREITKRRKRLDGT